MPRKAAGGVSVAVTGAAGYLGQRLIRKLCEDPEVSRVLGFDLRDPALRHERLVFDVMDVRDPAFGERLKGVDVLVHLAFVMDPIKDEAAMREANVDGSQAAFRAAGRAGVSRVVYTSSAVVYGAHPDNKIPLRESAPLRANLDFSYAAHKLEVEYVIREIEEEFPDLAMTILRPAIVFGPSVNNAWSHALELPLIFGVQGHSPPLQFVHEGDVVEALRFAIENDLRGQYNLAAEGWLEADEMLSVIGRRRIDLPEPLAFSLAGRMWDLGLAEAPPGMLHYVMHPWVVSTDKLASAGFTCKYSNMDAFRAAADSARGHIRLGTRRLKRSSLMRGALTGAGVAGALAATRVARRRRSSKAA